MKRLIFILPLIAATGCDKAKNLGNQVTTAVKKQIDKSAGKDGSTEVDAELAKLVHNNAEGAVFRKDLPFPKQIEVTVTSSREVSCRIFRKSEIERKVEEIKGTRIATAKLERNGDQVVHTLQKAGFRPPVLDKEEAAKVIDDPFRQVTADFNPMEFVRKNNSWSVNSRGNFRSAAVGTQIAPVFESLLEEYSVSAKPMWFSKKRVKVGDSFTLANESLGMLVAGNPSGTLKITLEAFEPVHGHPCGVFAVSGEYSRKNFPDFDGVFADETVNIQSGKLWLSLVYPVVIKEELDIVQTWETGGRGGLSIRSQGSVKVTIEREWKAKVPEAQGAQ